MPLQLFNTLSRRKEAFQPIAPPRVTYYNCGPTVYDAFHMGNARNFIVADILRRWLRASGYEVVFVQNLTDVDDKIIARAAEEGRSPEQVAAHYTDLYFRFADALGVERATHHPRATEFIGPMIEMVDTLVAKGHAYASGGDVYFDHASYADYGRLSRRPLDDMEQGERVDESVLRRKKSPQDFALWKSAKPGEPSWASPWGPGRPGWHLECSVMSTRLLGDTIDLHSGGEDLIFPHHENEVAQSCCATGHEFVRTWVHNGFLTFGDKVSKSTMTAETRALFMIDKALARFPPEAIRWFLITAHYRGPLAFTPEGLEEARARTAKVRHACAATRQFLAHDATLWSGASERPEVTALATRFRAAMDDDLNTPQALAVVADAITHMNTLRARADRERAAGEDTGAALELMQVYQLLGEQLECLGLKSFLFDAAGPGSSAGAGGAGAAVGGAEAGSVVGGAAAGSSAAGAAAAAAVAGDEGSAGAAREASGVAGAGVAGSGAGSTSTGGTSAGGTGSGAGAGSTSDGSAAPDRSHRSYSPASPAGSPSSAAAAPPSLDDFMARLIAARAAARVAKKWAVADAIRDKLAALGLRLEDGASGTLWRLDEGAAAPSPAVLAALLEEGDD